MERVPLNGTSDLAGKLPTLMAATSKFSWAYGLAAIKLLIHVLTLRPYGFFRDELYYIACSDHLDWGYVDQPPFCVVVLKAWRLLFGDSLAALRMLPALVGAATVLVTGLLVIELGGEAVAVGLAGLAVLVAGQFLGTAHYYSMNVFDQFFWVLAALLTVRALRERTPRTWVLLGVALGLGLLNKTSVLWLGAGLFVGLLATPMRSVLKTPWPYVAGAIAALLFTPYVIWEIRHGWPTLEFMTNAMREKYVEHSFGKFLHEQVDQNDPFTLPIWVAGLIALVLRRLGARAAVLGWTYVAVFAIVASQKTAKAEYLSPSYPMLMAAGGIFWERSLERLSRRWIRHVAITTMIVTMIAGGLLSAPFALAVLPEETFIAYEHALGKRARDERTTGGERAGAGVRRHARMAGARRGGRARLRVAEPRREGARDDLGPLRRVRARGGDRFLRSPVSPSAGHLRPQQLLVLGTGRRGWQSRDRRRRQARPGVEALRIVRAGGDVRVSLLPSRREPPAHLRRAADVGPPCLLLVGGAGLPVKEPCAWRDGRGVLGGTYLPNVASQ
jgi:Dolichyl-phosphate-mannose-protein mannosyltransferase